MISHQITANYEKGLSFSASIDQYLIPMDTTGEDSSSYGPSPKKLMLASLAGCTGIDIVSILHKMKVVFSAFAIDINANLTETHPSIYDQVEIIYKIKLDTADRPKMERAVTLSMEKYCGVSAMFEKFATVTHRIEYLGE